MAEELDVAAATVEATAASNLFCAPVSPGVSSTDSEPSSLRRVTVRGFDASSAVLPGTAAAVLLTAGGVAGPGALAGASPDGSCLPQALNASSVTANHRGSARNRIIESLADTKQDYGCLRERASW